MIEVMEGVLILTDGQCPVGMQEQLRKAHSKVGNELVGNGA